MVAVRTMTMRIQKRQKIAFHVVISDSLKSVGPIVDKQKALL